MDEKSRGLKESTGMRKARSARNMTSWPMGLWVSRDRVSQVLADEINDGIRKKD